MSVPRAKEQFAGHEALDVSAHLATSAAMRVALMHELGQPLSALATYIHASRHLLDADGLDRTLLADTMIKAEAELQRAREVLARLRAFLVCDKAQRSPVDFLDLVRNVTARLAHEASRRSVRLEVEAEPLPLVLADAPQLGQVLINLVSNGIDAAAQVPHGVVRVRCCQDNGGIAVEVDDNGKGIAPEIAEHLFEPFQTTKARGMGLGLPLSRQIVEAHGGRIWWEGAVPQGTRFHVMLPAAAPVHAA